LPSFSQDRVPSFPSLSIQLWVVKRPPDLSREPLEKGTDSPCDDNICIHLDYLSPLRIFLPHFLISPESRASLCIGPTFSEFLSLEPLLLLLGFSESRLAGSPLLLPDVFFQSTVKEVPFPPPATRSARPSPFIAPSDSILASFFFRARVFSGLPLIDLRPHECLFPTAILNNAWIPLLFPYRVPVR